MFKKNQTLALNKFTLNYRIWLFLETILVSKSQEMPLFRLFTNFLVSHGQRNREFHMWCTGAIEFVIFKQLYYIGIVKYL